MVAPLAYSLLKSFSMTISDLLVIYFSIGAPCGVYVYFQIRSKTTPKELWLKTLFTFVFWVPTAVRFLLKNILIRPAVYYEKNDKSPLSPEREQKLYLIEKHLENLLVKSDLRISIYEFREMFQRYVGLTFAAQNESEEFLIINKELFYAAQNRNFEIADKCFQRRNRKRLFFHQTLARKDFLQFASQMVPIIADRENFAKSVIELVKILEDHEAQIAIKKILADNPQTGNYSAVNSLEKDLWKPPEHKLSTAN